MTTIMQTGSEPAMPSQARNEIWEEDLDYSIDTYIHSNIQYSYTYPTNLQTVLLNTSSNSQVVTTYFQPTVGIFNKYRHNYQLQIGGHNGDCVWVNANAATHIGAWTLSDQVTGSVWSQLQLGNYYASMLCPASITLNEFLTRSFFYEGLQTYTPLTSSLYTLNEMSRFSATQAFTAVTVVTTGTSTQTIYSGLTTLEQLVPNLNTAATQALYTVDLFPQNPYTSRRQFYVSQVSHGIVLDFSCEFSYLPLTCFDIGKNLYTPTILNSLMYYNAVNNFAFMSSSATDPTATPNGTTYISVTNNTILDSVINQAGASITNIYFTIANQNDPALAARSIKMVTEGQGLTVPFGFPTIVNQTFAASTVHPISQPVTSSYGMNLLGMIIAPFSTNVGTSPCYTNVHQRGVVSNYTVQFASKPLGNQTFYNCLTSQDYIFNQPFLTGSSIQTLGEYIYAEWIHVDSLCGTKPLYSFDATVISGRSLQAVNVQYQVSVVLSQSLSLSWYVLFLGQKLLNLTARGSFVVQ